MKATYLLIGCLCASANLASTAYGDTTLYLQSTFVGEMNPRWALGFTFPTPTDLLNNYDHIQAVFNAPSGYAFSISGGVVTTYIVYGDPSNNTRADSLFEGSTINFVPGMAGPTTYGSGGVDENDNIFDRGYPKYPAGYERRNNVVDQNLQFDGPAEFTSFTLQWKVDPNPDYPNLTLAPFASAGFAGPYSTFSFVPIPEPNIAALALLGVTAFAVLRARRTPGCRAR
jgi:hypothetical protein